MKSMNKKIALGVLSVAMFGMGASNASASLLGHIVNNVGNTTGHILNGTGEVLNGVGNTVDEVLGGVGLTAGAGALLLEQANIDLHDLDVTSWTEADAQVLLDLQALGIDVNALVDATAILDASIITDEGIDIDALVCVLANGSLDVGLFGTNVVSTDLVVNIGAALGFDIDPSGLDLGLAVGECTTCDVDGPVNPNNPGGSPTSPVPEPATAALGLMGLGAMAVAARRRRNK